MNQQPSSMRCVLTSVCVSEKRNQDVQVQRPLLPAAEPLRAVPQTRQRLLPLPARPPGGLVSAPVWDTRASSNRLSSSQLIPQVSSLSWFTTAIPLIFVLAITAVKDASDDIVSPNEKPAPSNESPLGRILTGVFVSCVEKTQK